MYMLFQYSIFIRRLAVRWLSHRIYTYDETKRDEKLHKRHRNECNCASESVTCVQQCAQTVDSLTVFRFGAETKHAIVHSFFFALFFLPSQRLLKQIDWENRCTVENDTIENESIKLVGWSAGRLAQLLPMVFYTLSRCCSKWRQRVAVILSFAVRFTH